MDTKGVSFIDHIILVSAYSKLAPESLSDPSHAVGGLERRIISLLDSIFSTLSSAYREAKVKLSHQVMIQEAGKKYVPMKEATQNILTKKTESAKDVSLTPLKKVEPEDKLEKLTKVKDALELTLNDLRDSLDESGESEEEVESSDESSVRFYDAQNDARLDPFFDAEVIDDGSPLEEVVVVGSEEENLEHLKDYLTTHPEAMGASTYAYEQIATDEFAENFKELFGELDPTILTATDPKIHDIAEQHEVRKALKELHQSAIKDPGALAGFLFFLQMHVASGGSVEDYLKAKEIES